MQPCESAATQMEVARCFRTNWDQVYRAVEYVVDYGLAHRRLDQVTALGVDEVQFGKGNNFVTLVYQIDTYCRRLLWMGQKRTMKTLDAGFTALEQEHQRKQEAAGARERTSFLGGIAVVCTDIWKAYLQVAYPIGHPPRALPAAFPQAVPLLCGVMNHE
jgi:transposase